MDSMVVIQAFSFSYSPWV